LPRASRPTRPRLRDRLASPRQFGALPEKATLLKVIGNSFILSMIETIAEGQVVAEKTGLGVKELHQFIKVIVSRSVCGVLQSNAIRRLL
jgi:3-hydroxyisobutyrate dehydrogenase-like beta-hydroxyacid dehydrogenase